MTKKLFLLFALLAMAWPCFAQTQGCSQSGSDTSGTIQSYSLCFPLIIDGRNKGGWIALYRAGDQSNSELQGYSPTNAIIQNGYLTEILNSRSETFHYYPAQSGVANFSANFVSAFVQWNTYNITGGDILIRAKTPSHMTNGAWPTIWLLGSNCQFPSKVTADNTTFNGETCNWANTGSQEIDIFEQNPSTNITTNSNCILWFGAGNSTRSTYTLTDPSQNWHIYELRWVSGTSLQWYLDGVHQTGCDISSNVPSAPMFLQLNVAVAPGSTSSATPGSMEIDWVEVCQPSPCTGNGGNIVFYDDFVTAIATNLLRPLSRTARAAGQVIVPSTAPIPGIIADASAKKETTSP